MVHIYQITNTVNGKIYVGKTNNLNRRWYEHRRAGTRGGNCKYLNRAFNKHGNDAFEIQVLDYTESDREASELEKLYIGLFQANNSAKGYNLTKGGEGVAGLRWSQEARLKLSASQRGKAPSIQCLTKAWAVNTGKTCAQETRQRISESQKNKPRLYARCPRTLEWKRKIAEAQSGHKARAYRHDVADRLLVGLYEAGNSLRVIGRHVGMAHESVAKRLLKAGVVLRTQRRRGILPSLAPTTYNA